MPVACPRHGVLDVAPDAPCPTCGVAAYNLDERGARDVVRPIREHALKARKVVAGVVVFVAAAAVASQVLPVHLVVFNVDLALVFVAAAAASFGARPLAVLVERTPALRELDQALAARRV